MEMAHQHGISAHALEDINGTRKCPERGTTPESKAQRPQVLLPVH